MKKCLICQNDFYYFDSAKDGDPYENLEYINNFKTIMKSCQEKQILEISYNNSLFKIIPYKLIYSSRDDRFRLIGFSKKGYKKYTLNLSKINSVKLTLMEYQKLLI